jgi:hypothetical protein
MPVRSTCETTSISSLPDITLVGLSTSSIEINNRCTSVESRFETHACSYLSLVNTYRPHYYTGQSES